ncbi:malonyl-CoA decarboxylase [Vreelandella utahensis]|uniref:malonyl-CoA decarboxylase n=1 Tax=Vreelandella halophila TaxID=86177 RepID=UPI000984FB8E|nr:malonyl-CoA decarboxylase [Halomonas utahensis]
MSFLQDLLSRIVTRSRENTLDAPPDGRQRTDSALEKLESACNTLMQGGGEASRILVAQKALEHYASLDVTERLAFFTLLTEQYTAEPSHVHAAYAAYREEESSTNLQRLFNVCEPRRQELLRRLNLCPGGTFELVKMRSDLLNLLRDSPELAPLDADFVHLFTSWFNRGFLMLESIDWNTPATVLEKIIRYEAVHEIRDWSDLRRRLDPQDRRCYAFFHPAIGDEPLVFVEVALCKGVAENIKDILESDNELSLADVDTAVFYSISNCQRGLKGISFGNFLIKQVVQELKRELPRLTQFVTLSPVPGFANWLDKARRTGRCQLSPAAESALESNEWVKDTRAQQSLESELRAEAAHYLVNTKNHAGQPFDPVARFHLGNGASLHQINWPGDTSSKGLHQAHGLMVNYRYQLDQIEKNHEAYSREGTVICTPDIRREAVRAKTQQAESADV